jgi:hypothetical protein
MQHPAVVAGPKLSAIAPCRAGSRRPGTALTGLGRNLRSRIALLVRTNKTEADMGFGRGALLWLLGVPLPIVLLLALFWHH